MEFSIYCLIIITIIILNILYNNRKKMDVNIYIGNSFHSYYQLPTKPIICEKHMILYKCNFNIKNNIKYRATIFNGNRKFPTKTNFSYNIIMTVEKLSQVLFMKNIGDGRNKNYQLAVDYRLFSNKWHISYPIYSDYNVYNFVQKSKSNFDSISQFLKRKNIVYIQKVSYSKRQNIVKEFMKYIKVDSYGRDLNNIEWPKNISKNNKIDILKQYKFCIAIENSIITWKEGTKYEAPSINDDYVTEKLVDCLLAGSIPIYFGPKNIDQFLPHPDSIINIRDYTTVKNLTDYIESIMNNSKLLHLHLQWYDNISKEWFTRFNKTYYFNYCKICNHLS